MNRQRVHRGARSESGARGLAVQRRFFERLGTDQPFRQLFEHLHGVYFFAKDTSSRLMAATPPIVERLGGKQEKDIIGASDDEFFPPELADSFVRDDRWVISQHEKHESESSIVCGQLLQHGRAEYAAVPKILHAR